MMITEFCLTDNETDLERAMRMEAMKTDTLYILIGISTMVPTAFTKW